MKPFEIAGLPPAEINSFLSGTHSDPFLILGPHRVGDDVCIRVFRPDAKKIEIVTDRQSSIEMEKVHRDGFFQVAVPGATRDLDYKLRVTSRDDSERITRDPYSYGAIMGEVDQHLFTEGQHWEIYEKFGAHLRTMGDEAGVYFAVWAPNAERVSVVGDFNGWDGRVHPMASLGASGVWELFLPGLAAGSLYKFEIRNRHTGAVKAKADPFGRAFEKRPATAALTTEPAAHPWGDAAWLARRANWDWQHAPLSIYEMHAGSWMRHPDGRVYSYRELTERLPG